MLDATLEREAGYVRAHCTTLEVDQVFRSAVNCNTVLGQVPNFTGENAQHLQHVFYQEVRQDVVVQLRIEEKENQL